MINEVVCGETITGMKLIADNSIDCCVTSPPYWGLRDYGNAYQIGLEVTPEEYVEKLVNVFREVKRILKKEGTCWLNLGDSYYNYRTGAGQSLSKQTIAATGQDIPIECGRRANKQDGLKEKDLVGIPWMVAFALRADGWYLRQDIIWHKPNPMPESVEDRCTKSHEYVFLLTKSPHYYFNSEAISEKSIHGGEIVKNKSKIFDNVKGFETHVKGDRLVAENRNKRSVWTITTKGFSGAHFAVFPHDLIEPMILAGCPEGGIVLDPFMGSFTTARTAKDLSRNFIGLELNPKYCEIGEKRLQQQNLF